MQSSQRREMITPNGCGKVGRSQSRLERKWLVPFDCVIRTEQTIARGAGPILMVRTLCPQSASGRPCRFDGAAGRAASLRARLMPGRKLGRPISRDHRDLAPHRQQRGARNGTSDGQIGRRRAHLNAPVNGIVAAGRCERVLTALAQRDLFLGRWLVFMQRHPLVVMPTMGDLALPHNRDTTREDRLRWLDSNRITMIAPVLGIPPLAVPVGHHGRVRPGAQIMASRFARICALMPARSSKR